MLLFHSFGVARIGDVILFTIHAADLWLLAFATLLLGVMSVAFARKPQPVPSRRAWAVQRHPSGKGRRRR